MLEGLATAILETAAKRAVEFLATRVERENERLYAERQAPLTIMRPATEVVSSRLQDHIAYLGIWCGTATFEGLKAKKSIGKIFVSLDTFLVPQRSHMRKDERDSKQPLLQALVALNEHAVILGQPGAGKTTSVQKICLDAFKAGKALLNHNMPVVLRLRDVKKVYRLGPIFDLLTNVLGLSISIRRENSEVREQQYDECIVVSLCKYLDELGIVLILDGFDEIPPGPVRESALEDIKHLARELRRSRMVLTSRTADFEVVLERTTVLELAPLSIEQVSEFALRWLGDQTTATHFLERLAASPFSDLSYRPLTIAHLCAVYERIGDVPEKPKIVYKKIVYLLLEEWDVQRDIKRPSKYAAFDTSRKLEFLAALAYCLTTSFEHTAFAERILAEAYKQIHQQFELPQGQAVDVVREIESHSGLMISSGFDSYEFAHKSLQEYLAAEHIVRLPTLMGIPPDKSRKLPNELAIAVALSAWPSQYLAEVVLRVVTAEARNKNFYQVFGARLLLEKPTFTYTRDGSIAAVLVLALINERSKLLELFGPLLQVDALTALTAHYKFAGHDGEFVLLELRSRGGYEMPQHVALPKWLIAESGGISSIPSAWWVSPQQESGSENGDKATQFELQAPPRWSDPETDG